ncbi:hypothetical protein [Arvimicrobium flavum]|uniref:hypothetical protein n=1 Tax=Arvimicrobium flavum TaxID=3393320 RepID=UPI00237C4660|nr:hypothetical protein [Mesorhizobium shangrilense]
MTMKRKLVSAGATALLAVLLAGCMSGTPSGRPPTGAQTSGVDGDWVGTDGVAISSLNQGQFASRSMATGETLTTGSYTFRDQRTIDLDFFSVKSQQSTRATCILVDLNQMNCTLATGTQFVLTRKLA